MVHYSQPSNNSYLPTTGEFAGVGARLPFRHVHSALFVETVPVVGNLASGIVERHWDGGKQAISAFVDERKLHQLGAVDGFIVGQIQIVVRTAEVSTGMNDG